MCSWEQKATCSLFASMTWMVAGGKQQPYAFRLTEVTSAPQALAKIGALRVLQQTRDFVEVAMIDRVKSGGPGP